jgi:hypothetical protein
MMVVTGAPNRVVWRRRDASTGEESTSGLNHAGQPAGSGGPTDLGGLAAAPLDRRLPQSEVCLGFASKRQFAPPRARSGCAATTRPAHSVALRPCTYVPQHERQEKARCA